MTALVTGESGRVFLSKTTSGLIASANCFAQIFTPVDILLAQSAEILWPATASVSATNESFASPKIATAPCLIASCSLIFIDANLTFGFWNIDCEPVAKSVNRVPIEIIKSASATNLFVSGEPSKPRPIRCQSPGF